MQDEAATKLVTDFKILIDDAEDLVKASATDSDRGVARATGEKIRARQNRINERQEQLARSGRLRKNPNGVLFARACLGGLARCGWSRSAVRIDRVAQNKNSCRNASNLSTEDCTI